MSVYRNRKAVSTILIALLVVAVVVVVIGAAFVYLWYLPGNLKTEEMPFSDFTALEVGSAFQVSVTQSDIYSVTITAGERIFDRIDVTQSGETLKLDVNPGVFFGAFNLKAEITMPTLDTLILSGATTGIANDFNSTNPFDARVSGASSLDLKNFTTGDVNIELSGASHLTAEGTGSNLISDVSGASDLDLSNFNVKDANVGLSGASHATIKLDGRLDVEASGASSLVYIGEPTKGNINTSGGSTVNKK